MGKTCVENGVFGIELGKFEKISTCEKRQKWLSPKILKNFCGKPGGKSTLPHENVILEKTIPWGIFVKKGISKYEIMRICR